MAQDKPVKVEATRLARATPWQGQSGREPAAETFDPVVDIYETDNELVLVAEVPGADREDISVQVDKGVLTVEADAKFDTPGDDYARTYVSFSPGEYFRAFALSDEVDRDKINASVVNGLLTVHLPKAEAAKSRQIDIKVTK